MGRLRPRGNVRFPLDLWIDIKRRDDDVEVESSDDEDPELPDSPSPIAAAFGPSIDSPSPAGTSIAATIIAAPPTVTSTSDSPSPPSITFPVVLNPAASASDLVTTTSVASVSTTSATKVTSTTVPPPPLPPSSTSALATNESPTTTMITSAVPLSSVTSTLTSAQPVSSTISQSGDSPQATTNIGKGASDADQQLGPVAPQLVQNNGAKIGIAMGTIAAVALLASLIFVYWKWRKRGRNSIASSFGFGFRKLPDPPPRKSGKSQSKVLDELITAARAAEEGEAGAYGPEKKQSFVMPNGFVANEKRQAAGGADPAVFLPNEPVAQPGIRKSIAKWLGGQDPLMMNPLSRKSTPAPSTIAPDTPTVPAIPPAMPPAFQGGMISRWSESTRSLMPPAFLGGMISRWSESTKSLMSSSVSQSNNNRETRMTEGSVYLPYTRTPSGLSWAMDQAATDRRRTSTRTSSQAGGMPWQETLMEQSGLKMPQPVAPVPDPTAVWVEQTVTLTGDAPREEGRLAGKEVET